MQQRVAIARAHAVILQPFGALDADDALRMRGRGLSSFICRLRRCSAFFLAAILGIGLGCASARPRLIEAADVLSLTARRI
jgi:hypothetical protein